MNHCLLSGRHGAETKLILKERNNILCLFLHFNSLGNSWLLILFKIFIVVLLELLIILYYFLYDFFLFLDVALNVALNVRRLLCFGSFRGNRHKGRVARQGRNLLKLILSYIFDFDVIDGVRYTCYRQFL